MFWRWRVTIILNLIITLNFIMPRMTSNLLMNRLTFRKGRELSPNVTKLTCKDRIMLPELATLDPILLSLHSAMEPTRDRREGTPSTNQLTGTRSRSGHFKLRAKHGGNCLHVFSTQQAPGPSAWLTLASSSSEHISEVKRDRKQEMHFQVIHFS